MVSLQGIEKYFGSVSAVNAINLVIPGQQTTALMGPSGSGKSTLLRMIMGLIAPDQGQILIRDVPMNAQNALPLRRRMGYVRQDGGLFPHLTAIENIELMANFLKWPKEKRRERVATLCEIARFETSQLDRYPSQLSGGQRQRVSLMRALMLDPDVLLLDEPLAALDPIIRSELQEELRTVFHRLRKTVVLVTHDLSEAGYLGEHLVLLSEGTIVQSGPLTDFIQRPANDFVKKFVGAQRSLAEVLFS